MKIIGIQDFFKVGHTAGNLEKMLKMIEEAQKVGGPKLLVFPELAITGYFPQDLLYRPDYRAEVVAALEAVKKACTDMTVILGHPLWEGKQVYNALSVIENQAIELIYRKQHLPNSEVFDERRYFVEGKACARVTVKGLRLALSICEDIWHPQTPAALKKLNPQGVLVINASPFAADKFEKREHLLSAVSAYLECPLLYLNLVGAQDDLVFDGASMAFNGQGLRVCQAPWFKPAFWSVQWKQTSQGWDIVPDPTLLETPSTPARIYEALVLATRTYHDENRFKGILLGLSGGIDSALTLAIAVDAIGAANVKAVFLPSRYSSALSESAAVAQCQYLGVTLESASIEPTVTAIHTDLAPLIDDMDTLTAQNIQARMRAVILMALSNQTGALLLSTGNKSEYAQGYCTLYGDMAGGFAPLKDVYKTQVFELSQYRNQQGDCIPDIVLTRAPTAELAPDQYDEDHLPPYPILDGILQGYLERHQSIEELVAAGYDLQQVKKVITALYRSEYKRQQAPIGPKVSALAFGRERRYPITQHFV